MMTNLVVDDGANLMETIIYCNRPLGVMQNALTAGIYWESACFCLQENSHLAVQNMGSNIRNIESYNLVGTHKRS